MVNDKKTIQNNTIIIIIIIIIIVIVIHIYSAKYHLMCSNAQYVGIAYQPLIAFTSSSVLCIEPTPSNVNPKQYYKK